MGSISALLKSSTNKLPHSFYLPLKTIHFKSAYRESFLQNTRKQHYSKISKREERVQKAAEQQISNLTAAQYQQKRHSSSAAVDEDVVQVKALASWGCQVPPCPAGWAHTRCRCFHWDHQMPAGSPKLPPH